MGSSSFSNPTSCVSTSLPNTIAKEEKKKNKKKGGGSGSGVKLSTDPQSVAARQRRHRISDRFKTLQSLVPGGSKLDTASMLEEAIQYVKFLKAQILLHQAMIHGGFGADHHDPDPVFLPEPNNNICPVVQFRDEHVDHLCDEYSGDIAVVEGEMGLGWPVSCFSGEGNGGAFDASM